MANVPHPARRRSEERVGAPSRSGTGRWIRNGAIGIAAIAAAGYVAFDVLRGDRWTDVRATLSLEQTLGGDAAGHQRAFEPRTFLFPRDHGAHPDYRNEWWYLTGNLESDDGRRFGYQLTLFRTALAPDSPERESAWATRQAWMAHFALTDVEAGRHHAFERFARGAIGLAGADSTPFRVWLESWSIEAGGTSILPLRVRAEQSNVAIDLVLRDGKPFVLNGDAGLSRKGREPGNASYYYSFTRLPSTGTVTVDGHRHAVSGASWIDREWSTSALAPGVSGWDWFAIQLDDSTELMVYRLRRDDGSTDPFSAGTFVDAEARTVHLGADDFAIDATAHWSSPVDDAPYPARWTLRVPSLDLSLDVAPVVADQEHTASFRYWEGAVDVTGSRAGNDVGGRGYVELTGYAGAGASRSGTNR
jgi:predicted secreted hydrolase